MDNQPISQTPELCCKNDRLFKALALIIGILIVIGLFGNIYLLLQKQKPPEQSGTLPTSAPAEILATPTIDPTADWNKYTSSLLGISFKYPSGWFSHKEQTIGGVSERPNKIYEVVFSYPVDNPSPQDFVSGQKAGITISYTPEPEQAFDVYINQLMGQEFGGKLHKSEVFIAGIKAIAINVNEPPTNRFIVFDNNGRYFISFNIERNEQYETYRRAFDQILSTFKFQ